MSDQDGAAPEAEAARIDGWENALTGLGQLSRDKRESAAFYLDLLTQEEALDLWRGDDMASRVVEAPVDEMLREGHCVKVEGDKDLGEELAAEAERLDLVETVREALHYARAFGGGGILLGVNDAAELYTPLRPERVQSLDWLSTFTPRELVPETWYRDPRQAHYGEPETYRLVPLFAPPGSSVENIIVHESRIVRFCGAKTTRLARINTTQYGWEDSVFVRIARVIRDFQAAFQAAGLLLSDFSTPVLKIKGLAKLLASRAPGDTTVAQRAAALELTRGLARVAILDSEEEYKRETTVLTGFGEMLDKLSLRLAAAASMPVSLLMGQAPAGLNATGAADVRWYYDRVSAMQERTLRPALRRLYTVVMQARRGPTGGKLPEHWSVYFEPLYQLSELEAAQVRKTQADTDALYITNQVATPQEIAKSRFGGDEYSTDTQIDADLRDELLSDEELQLRELGAQEPAADAPPGGIPPGGMQPGQPAPGQPEPADQPPAES